MLGDQLILQYYYRVSGSREGGGHGGSAPRGSLLEKVIVSRVKSPSKTHVHLNQVQILADPESASPTCHSPSAPRTPRPVSDLLPVSPRTESISPIAARRSWLHQRSPTAPGRVHCSDVCAHMQIPTQKTAPPTLLKKSVLHAAKIKLGTNIVYVLFRDL